MIVKGKLTDAPFATTANATDAKNAKSGRCFRKIQPYSCSNKLELHDVSFAYPSRPKVHMLDNVILLFAAGDAKLIVGGSRSGKSTIAQLMRTYAPSEGFSLFDEQDMDFLGEAWTR